MTYIFGHRNLSDLLEYRATAMPDKTFVIFDDMAGQVTPLTYAAFEEQTNRVAHLLRALGIQRGDRINLHLPNCLEFLYIWFGAAKLGAVIMPSNIASPATELEYLVGHSESRLIFVKETHREVAEEVKARCSCVERILLCGGSSASDFPQLADLMAGQPSTRPRVPIEPTDEAAILYTSGTTARPKGVVVTHANYLYAGETVAKAIALRPDDRHFVVLPLFHGNAQYYSTLSTLVTGASMALMARFSASQFFDQCIRYECTVTSLFAAPIRMLLAQQRTQAHRNNRLRVVLFAQNITEAQLAEWHERFGAPLLQLWGMTETMGPPLMNPFAQERRNLSMGLPAMGYQVSLVDESGAPTPLGGIGQIVVRGEPGLTLMKGYFKNPQATAETIRKDWLWSGDNARQDEEGYFYFVDRAKDMIKRSGENVAASEVESVILQHPKVFDCAVIGLPDVLRDEKIMACVVLHKGAQTTPEEIIAWCRQRLASFRVPEIVEFREELPRTSVGKIQKHLLRREAMEKYAPQPP